jgi:toxin ParE1/3/4
MDEYWIVRSPAAEDDLIDIWCSIARDNPAAADRVLETFAVRIKQLATFPDSGSRRPDIAPDARGLVVGSYLVLYRKTDKHVEIVRIVHGARDITALL